MLSRFKHHKSYLTVLFVLWTTNTMAETWYQPSVRTTWQWQLQGQLDTRYNVDVYDVDLFDTTVEQIQSLQRQNRKVICYFSAGSLEDWRDDIRPIPVNAIGKPLDGWAGEHWLDIRDKQVWRTMQNRIKLAAKKGCDGIEPDNVDGYQNDSGFPLTAQDQIAFNRFLAQSAHILKLSIGLKNSLGIVPELVDDFDFAVNEQCLEFQECDLLMPFIRQNKAVFHAEYQASSNLCLPAQSIGFSTLLLSLELDGSFRKTCP